MTVFIDLIGSWLVRVSMIAIMLGLTMNLNDALYQSTQRANNLGQTAVLDSIIYADLNDAGYNVSPVSSTFQSADTSSVQFLADINGGGIPETIRYTVTQQSDSSYNVYRYVNNVNNGVDLLVGNVARVYFSYYDAKDSVLNPYSQHVYSVPDPSKIKRIVVSLNQKIGVRADGTPIVDSTYYKIVPPNLL